MALAPLLSRSESLWFVTVAGIVVHLIFKRTETYEPTKAVSLFLGVPAFLTYLYRFYASSALWAAATVFSLFFGSLFASIALYRLSPWHPLAKYPGPIICKVTQFHLATLSVGGKQHMYYAKLHKKYGDIVRIGPNEVSICDVNAVGPMLGNAGMSKGPFWDGRIPEEEVVKPLIAIRDKTEHTRRRRMWTRAFSTNALKGYEELVIKRVTQLVDKIAVQKGTVDLTQWISFFAYDVMSDLAFGGGSEMMAEGDASGLWHLLEAGQKNAIFMGHVPWLGRLFLRYPKFAEDLKSFRAHALNRVILRKSSVSPHRDIFHHLMDEDGVAMEPPTTTEVTSDGGLAIIAGSDTTSAAITHLLYFLMCSPSAYKRLQAEIDELGDDLLDCTKQAHSPYLNASINESLRLLPPVLGGSQRTPDAGSGGKMIGSYFLPEGNNASIPTYSIHRDPRYFSPLPDTFLPERWLPEEERMNYEPKIFARKNRYIHNTIAFIPFSSGPTNCVGKNLAYLEMRMAVAMIVQNLDMRFDEGYNPETWYTDMLDYFVTLKGVLPTVLTLRKQKV